MLERKQTQTECSYWIWQCNPSPSTWVTDKECPFHLKYFLCTTYCPMVLSKLRHPQWYCWPQAPSSPCAPHSAPRSPMWQRSRRMLPTQLAHTHRTVKLTCRLPPSRVVMVMGVTDIDLNSTPGISLSDAVAFIYHVPDSWRRTRPSRLR